MPTKKVLKPTLSGHIRLLANVALATTSTATAKLEQKCAQAIRVATKAEFGFLKHKTDEKNVQQAKAIAKAELSSAMLLMDFSSHSDRACSTKTPVIQPIQQLHVEKAANVLQIKLAVTSPAHCVEHHDIQPLVVLVDKASSISCAEHHDIQHNDNQPLVELADNATSIPSIEHHDNQHNDSQPLVELADNAASVLGVEHHDIQPHVDLLDKAISISCVEHYESQQHDIQPPPPTIVSQATTIPMCENDVDRHVQQVADVIVTSTHFGKDLRLPRQAQIKASHERHLRMAPYVQHAAARAEQRCMQTCRVAAAQKLKRRKLLKEAVHARVQEERRVQDECRAQKAAMTSFHEDMRVYASMPSFQEDLRVYEVAVAKTQSERLLREAAWASAQEEKRLLETHTATATATDNANAVAVDIMMTSAVGIATTSTISTISTTTESIKNPMVTLTALELGQQFVTLVHSLLIGIDTKRMDWVLTAAEAPLWRALELHPLALTSLCPVGAYAALALSFRDDGSCRSIFTPQTVKMLLATLAAPLNDFVRRQEQGTLPYAFIQKMTAQQFIFSASVDTGSTASEDVLCRSFPCSVHFVWDPETAVPCRDALFVLRLCASVQHVINVRRTKYECGMRDTRIVAMALASKAFDEDAMLLIRKGCAQPKPKPMPMPGTTPSKIMVPFGSQKI